MHPALDALSQAWRDKLPHSYDIDIYWKVLIIIEGHDQFDVVNGPRKLVA